MSADDHGSVSTYTNHVCRCDECRAAWASDTRRMRAGRVQRLANDPTLADHGLASTYCNWGCRCRACTDAATRTRHRRRKAERA